MKRCLDLSALFLGLLLPSSILLGYVLSMPGVWLVTFVRDKVLGFR